MAAHLDTATYATHLAQNLGRLGAVRDDELATAVTTCPGWTVADLLEHCAGVFRFAGAQLRAEPGSDLVPFDPPAEGDPVGVVRAAGDALLEAIADTDPTEHRPNWVGAPTAAFWWRRMAQETAIHLADLDIARDRPVDIDPALAADGIDELVDVHLAHAAARGITGAGESVHLHATDDGLSTGEWMFTFTAEGVSVTHEHGKGDMAVRGPASQLLLFAWNRRPVHVECFGDPDPLVWWPRTVTI